MNATDDQSTPGLGPVVVNGIQDVSAFLPILGTDQCERDSTKGLERGYLYVAATPMSIFGSLGILKASLITFILGQDIAVGSLHGPRLLQNAGFAPDGILDLLMYALDSDDSGLVAEQKMRAILRGRPLAGVVPQLYSPAWVWNIMMVYCTLYTSGLGLVPYIYIITHDLGHRPFSSTWMYPVLRTFGSALAVTTMQFIIQFRILAVVRDHSVVEAATHLFKKEGRPAP